jgi:hypothetical protein
VFKQDLAIVYEKVSKEPGRGDEARLKFILGARYASRKFADLASRTHHRRP